MLYSMPRAITVIMLFYCLLASCSSKKTSRSGSESGSVSDQAGIEAPSTGVFAGNSHSVVGTGEPAAADVSGSYLIDVRAYCVGVKGETTASCKQVRLATKVKVGDAEPVRFAADTLKSLTIQSSSWDIPPSPEYSCEYTSGFAINPLCTAVGTGSLKSTAIRATLVLVTFGGNTHKGDSSDKSPTAPSPTGGVWGNFLLVDASPGFKPPGGPPLSNASASFTQIWQDLVSGLYFTNNLYEGQGSTNWDKSVALCRSVNSGDGAGKWHLPSGQELCGSAFDYGIEGSGPCPDGLYGHGLTDVPVVSGGISWDSLKYVWYSSPASIIFKWSVDLNYGTTYFSDGNFTTDYGVLCVRE